ncbi:MAG: gamma-glutamyltransferase [Gammaproteobacteria bacterium]
MVHRPVFRAPRLMLGLLTLALLSACATRDTNVPTPSAKDQASQAALAMPDALSADVVEAILARGGNAVDAAIAGALALAVTYPEAGNIGGGGFMLIHHEGQDYFLDYREVAPAAASRDMYLDADGNVVDKLSLVGHLAAGVPGTVAGLAAAHERFGSLPWTDLVAPALALARDGFIAPPLLAERVAGELESFDGRTNFADYFANMTAQQRFAQSELAATLRRIQTDGRDGFYRGETADFIARDMRRHGGLITTEDLSTYQPIWREPLRARWRDQTIVSAPPPSSGGFAVIQLLKMHELLAAEFAGLDHNSAQYVHLIAEMEKRVFADRAEYFGDPDFVDVPIQRLIDAAYIARRASDVNTRQISQLESVRPGLESRHTTHFSIVDHAGNAVSNTYTLNTMFGSGAVVEGAGFLLNNEMDDFSAKPGVPNFYGVIGRDANAIEPRKRMLSSMSPTILLRNGSVDMVLGSPGGSTIFTSVFQGVLNVKDFGMSATEAASVGRFHHQLLPPDEVTFSRGYPLADEVIRKLRTRGYNAHPHPWEFGDLQIIARTPNGFDAGADARGRGVARVLAPR